MFSFGLEFYKLDGHEPVPIDVTSVEDLIELGRLYESEERRVACTKIGDVEVSTVFLCVDTAYIAEEHVPILFETMVFGGEMDEYCERWCTWGEAEEGHKAVVEQVAQAEAK
jgi:hypothetical protein